MSARRGLRLVCRRISRQTLVRPRVDLPQEHRAARVIRRFVERVEGRFEQRLGDERPVCRFTFVPVEELDGELADQQRTGLCIGGFFRRPCSG